MGVVEEALLGAILGALIQSIIAAKEKAVFFKRTLQHLECTIENVEPIIRQILSLENVHTETCDRFLQQLKKTKVLVEMYSDIKKWKLLKKRKVKKLIQEMDASLERIMKYDVQAEQLFYLATNDLQITELNKKMDQVIALFQEHAEESNPVNAEEDTPSDPETAESSQYKPSKPTFEFHWEIGKGKCLDIHFGRHHQAKE